MPANPLSAAKTDGVAWTFRAKLGEDTLHATLEYTDLFSDWDDRAPNLGTAHPDLDGFKLVEIVAERIEGSHIHVTLNYEVNNFTEDLPGRPGSEDPNSRYSVRTAGGEEHILTSPFAATILAAAADAEAGELEMRALYEISNGRSEQDDGTPWEDSILTSPGLNILKKIRRGNIAYRSKGLAYVERKIITDLADIEYDKLKTIQTPPGNPGGVSGGWLYDDATADPSPDGETWTLERIWLYSPDGWDPDLYAPPAP